MSELLPLSNLEPGHSQNAEQTTALMPFRLANFIGSVCIIADDSGAMVSYDHVRENILAVIGEQASALSYFDTSLDLEVDLLKHSSGKIDRINIDSFMTGPVRDCDHLVLWHDASSIQSRGATRDSIEAAIQFVCTLAASGKLTWIVPDERRFWTSPVLQEIVTKSQLKYPSLKVLFLRENKVIAREELSLFLDDNLSSEGAHGLKTSPEKSADRKIRVLRNSCGDHAVLLACHASLFSGVSGGYMEMIRTTFVPEASELDVCRIFQTSLMSSGLGTDGFTKGALFGFEDRATQEALVRLLVARYGVDHAQKVIAHRAKVEETPIDKCSTANSSILPHLLEAIYEPTAFVRRAQLLAQNALRNELRAADVRHWWYLCEYYAELPAMANFKANLLALSGMFDSLI